MMCTHILMCTYISGVFLTMCTHILVALRRVEAPEGGSAHLPRRAGAGALASKCGSARASRFAKAPSRAVLFSSVCRSKERQHLEKHGERV